MSNSFYNHGAFPSTGSAATSASMRAELDLVAAGFDKMPTLAGNANKFIVVNSTGTGLTQTDVLPAFTVTDTDFTVQDDGDNTRKFKFNAGSITTGNTRVYVMPDLDTTLVGTNVTQTLTNKTLTAPVIATIVNTGTLTLPTSTDTLVGRNTTDTLTNKTLTNPVIGTIVNTGTLTLPTSTDTLVGRQTTDTLTNKTISGASNTLSNIANGSLSNSSIVIGSSTLSLGGTLTTLAGVTISGASNTLSNIANASLTNSSITINGSTVALGSSVTVTATATNALTIGNGLSGTSYNGSSAVTIAINTGVTADLSTAQTFSNKTISGSANTLTNIANASLTNSAITIGSTAISLGATSLTLAGLTSASATTLISTGNQATSVAISAIGHSSGTVTVTTSTAHGLTTGDVASIDGVADYTFCGVYTVAVSNANVFTYSQTASGASSSGGFSTKLTGTWGLYAGGTGPSLANGPVMINASSQLPALRVTQGGSGYALIVEDAANPDTSAFIISNAGDLAINTNKFTVAAASGNTVIGGTTSFGGNIVSNVLFTDATYDIGATGANRPRDLFLSRNLVVGGTLTLAGGVNLNGNVTVGDASTDTLTINSTITSNLIFTDNTYDIGASGATRPRNLYLANNLFAASKISIATTSTGFELNVNGGINVFGPATLPSAQGSMVLTYDAPVNRIIMGDGSGYSFALSKRASSTTTDLLTLTDLGLLGLGGAPISTVRQYIKGTGATSATWSLYVDDSAASNIFYVRNDGAAYHSGNTGIGTSNTYGARFAVLGGALASSSVGVAISSQLTAGRLTTGNTNATTGYIGNFLDDSITELSAGSSGALTSGIVAFGGTAVVNPNSVKTYTGGTVRTTTDVNGLTIVGGLYASYATGAGIMQLGTASGRTQYQYLTFGGAVGGTDYGWQIGRSSTAGIVADGFYIYDIKGSLTRLAITLDGYVGIGGTSPTNQLTVYRTSATTSSGALRLDGNGNYAGVQFAASGTLYGSLSVDNSIMYLTHGSALAFRTGSTSNVGGTDRMFINSSGDVGINETSPSTFGKLVVKDGTINLVTDTGTSRRLSFWSQGNGNSQNAYIQVQNDGGTTNTGEIIFATKNVAGTLAERVRIYATGLLQANFGSYADPSLASSGSLGLQVSASASYNDNSAHTFTGLANVSAVIHIRAGNLSSIPFYPNGGGGVAYQWTALNPQTGVWNTGAGPTINFTENGSSPNSYSVVFNGGGGSFAITRTGGTTAYTVFIQLFATV